MIEIKVPDMMCNHCVSRITNALKEIGISCEIDLSKKVVTVQDDCVDKALAEIYDIGFTPEK